MKYSGMFAAVQNLLNDALALWFSKGIHLAKLTSSKLYLLCSLFNQADHCSLDVRNVVAVSEGTSLFAISMSLIWTIFKLYLQTI